MRKKYLKFRKVNLIVCLTLLVILMKCVYDVWSLFGNYGALQFIFSLFIHGSIIAILYFGIDYLLREKFNQEQIW